MRDELAKGNDELTQWVKENAEIFDATDDANTQVAFSSIASKIAEQLPLMKPGALDDFLAGADPWLIAKAMSTGAVVVTHEAYNPLIKRKFTIPNVCEVFGVPYMNTFELLSKLEARFVMHS